MEGETRLPVTVVTGFLGSGKTTLVNHILAQQHGLRIAVMVNEIGDLAIDNELIVGASDDMVELSNGCICCSINNDLVDAIFGVLRREPRIETALTGADVLIVLRVQSERIHEPPISLDDYILRYQLSPERLRCAKPDAIVLHPGPIIRGLEIDPAVADGPQSCILEQVTNGLAVRMALLFQLVSGAAPDAPHPAKENFA